MESWEKRLRAIREANNTAAWAMAEYIDETPAAITQALIQEADLDGQLPEEALFAAFMAGFSGVNEDDMVISGYFHDAVKKLDPSDYLDNPYLKTIRFPDTASRHWKFTHYTYRPYEAFIRDDIRVDEELREVPQVGYFRERFTYPAVEQDGREWMAVKPSEIATMQPALTQISGMVVTFGLGLGYFAFMAAEKPEVVSVDVVERDEEAIALFREHLLPQFPHRDKVRIIHMDAFSFMHNEMLGKEYDYAFVDLWHDTSDGLELYLRSRHEEALLKASGDRTTFLYWVEKSLLSAWRWNKFDEIVGTCHSAEEAGSRLSDNALRSMIMDSSLH